MTEEQEETLLQRVQNYLDAEACEQLDQLLLDTHPADIADLLESLPPERREAIWARVQEVKSEVDKDVLADVLAHAEGMVRASLLETMAIEDVAEAAEILDADDAADILQDLPEARYEEVLLAMDEQNRRRIETLVSYPEDTAGGLMDTQVLTVRADVTLEAVLRYLRRHEELPDKTDMLLVIDRNNVYQGGLLLSRLLTHQTEQLVEEVMSERIEGIPATMSDHDVAALFEQRDWVSAPVVDENGHLLGRITIDDVVDVIREEAEHTLMGRAGLDEEDDMFAPIIDTTRSRALWLGINLLTAFLAAWVIGLFEATLQQLVALAVLMPIVASMGGIAGTQTLTVMVRGIALGKVVSANSLWLMRKELAVGFLNGLMWAAVVGLVALIWFGSTALGVIIAVALTLNMVFAALSGTLIPLLLKKLNIDPALAGGVVLTTITDVVGFFAFLGLATVFLLP